MFLFSTGLFSQEILISDGGTVNTCSGTFYDSGGPSGVYGANEDFTITICPENDAQVIELDFQSFTTQPVQNGNGDGLIIYNGDSTSAEEFGMFSGTSASSSPGFIVADNPSGCLTIQFFSNGAAQASGWEATISCFEPCQDVTAAIDSNPGVNVDGSIEVDLDQTIDFTGIGGFSSGNANNATYEWNLDDGTILFGENVQHSYSTAGLYNVTLLITDYNDCTSNIAEVQVIAGATTPGNPYVSAGDDINLECPELVQLSADFLEIGETDLYEVVEIAFVPPFPFQGLSNSVNTNIDDAWDSPQALPFDFCFFGNLEQQFQVGSNGLVRFDVNAGDSTNGWAFSNGDNIPTNSPDAIGEGNIFSPVHDINPASSDGEEIRWEIIGEYPNRVLAVSFYNVEMYSCGDLLATHMIVMYETTNVIDIYIQNKPTCNSWQGGVAAVGIQNDSGTQGYVPPGRNSSDSPWTTQEEAWRFTPVGDSIIEFEWLDLNGDVISTEPDFEVLPSETTSYTAKVTYTTCTGNPIVVEDEIIINVEEPPFNVESVVEYDEDGSTIIIEEDVIELCSDVLPVLINSQYESETASYEWYLDGQILGVNDSFLNITSAQTGIYTVEVYDQDCIVYDVIRINFGDPNDSSFELTATCDGATATVTGLPGGSFAFVDEPADGAVIDTDTGTITGGSYSTTYNVEYTTNDACPSTSTLEVTTLDPDNSSFELTATCDGATATVTGLPGGSFTFADEPADGAVIDPDTGTITGGQINSEYFVDYTTNSECSSTTTISIITLEGEDSSFELTATCDGAIATVTGLPGGSFAFADAPADEAVIDPDTGTITGGQNNTTYNIIYTTDGSQLCSTTTSIQVTSLSADDSSFELTATCDGATATVTGVSGGSFAFADEPADGAIIDPATGTITGGSSYTTYNVEYTTSDACPTTSTLEVTTLDPDNSSLDIIDPSPLQVCDDNIADGLTEMDLTIKNSEITNGNPNYSVSYYFSETNALNGENPLPVNYTNISNPQTVYVRIVDINTNCFATTTLDLNVITAPSANAPPALEYCDEDADGFGVFNLSQLNEVISDGQTGLTITYHETQADAENNVNAIIGEYNNINPYTQTVFIRIESSTVVTDCATYLDVLLVVNDVPQINTDSSSLEVCDDDTDGFGLFDLSLSNEEVLNGLDPSEFTITYYETPENAENAENPIITPFAYTNITAFNQTVWVRVENNTTECYNTSSIELTVNELPVLTQPDPLNLCDYNNPGDEVEEFTLEDSIGQVLQGQTGIGITFYETQEDADNATNPIASPYTNTSNAQTIYLRGENEITGCYSTITLDLRVNPIPSPVVPDPIEECDEDNDGFTFFNVEDNEVDIINGELDIVLSYYETTTNAENAVDPIISPYYNIVPDSQIIFVRAENIVTGCFTIVEQELVTIPSPELPLIIEDIVVCDDDYDGITVFDLSQRDEDIFGEQSTTDFGLTYHETLIDAETGENPIVNTTSYQNLTNPQTIFVRLEDLNNDCVSIGEFNLIVALPPVIVQPTALEECDDEVADETTEFDLTVKNDEITAGNIDWEVIYYETQEDALAGTNAIENPEAYTNTAVAGNAANPQTLHVAVVNIEGCIAYTTLTIRVLPNPTPSTDAEDIELCDYDNPGDQIEVFDITINEAYIINGELGVSAAYYESLENATDEIDPIANPTTYSNIELGQQTIYVRVTNDTTGCFTIVTFDIIVNPLPDIGDVPDVIACEINTDGFFDFDLETVTSELLGAQDPANFTVTYHETQEDADNGENALVSPYTNLTNPQQLFVNITNNLTGCNITGAGFNIEVQEAAIANGDGVPAELIICDDPNTANDGFAQFNLTDLDAQILDGQDPVNFTVTYYATIEDAEASTNPLPTSFENTSNPQTIFVRVDNDTNVDDQCYDITDATLLVNLLPEFTLEDSYMACVDVNGTELIGPTVMLIDLPVNEYTFEWINPMGDLEATTAAHTPLMGGIYTAVATDILTGCRKEVTTEVIPSSPAIVEAVVTTLAFAEEHVIEANAVGSGDYEYRLDDGPWQLDGTFTDVSPGEHIVTVRDLNGCGIGTKSVLVIDYPRFFTPNGDGYNDTWQIIGIDTRPLSTIYIFDRYGKLLKQLSPLSEGWDGTFNGKPLPATDYWFSVKYEEPGTEIIKTFRAHFSLKR
ncbi:MAG: hypothetical protein CM15mP36_09820 [Flavobacteriales bacterium]|nr:MAG: hypothetical protein CM15mP36_09820 [Flavobacteriales bacterium]